MKKQPHVVLRTTRSAGAGVDFSSPGAAPAVIDPADLSVEVEEVAPRRMSALAKDPTVLSVAPVMPMKLITPVSAPATPSAGTVDWGVTAVGAPTSPFTGDGVVVAVLDTGIDPTHPAFAGVTLVRKNFTSESDNDLHGHGTHCAGTIFGRDTGGRRIGVARGVKKAVIGKVLAADGGSSETIASAIQWAVQEGAHVVSMSLGMDFPGFQSLLVANGLPPELATSKALEGYRLNVLLFERLASFIRQLGSMVQSSIIVAAAGNESQTNVDPDFKIAVSPPAVSEGIISVAALGQSGAKFSVAPFSNTGAMVSGPGVGITSARPGGGLATMSGTSMATPHVAGVAALWAQKMMVAGPLTPSLLATKVVASGVTTNLVAGFDPTDVGSGLVQAPQS